MKLTLLNNKQVEELKKLLGFYKRFYLCNVCGAVYGSDLQEREVPRCPLCEKANQYSTKELVERQ